MFSNISKKNMIIIGIIIAVIVGTLGGLMVSRKKSEQVVINGESQKINSDSYISNQNENAEPKNKEILIHIIGRVKNSGVVKISENGRVEDAIEAAGGALPDADLELINLAYKLQDGQQVYIPAKSETVVKTQISSSKSKIKASETKNVDSESLTKTLVPGVQPDKIPPVKAVESLENGTGNSSISTSSKLVNINTATEAELDALPQIGPTTAKKIIEYRQQSGNFKKIEDVMNVKGIGQSKYNYIKDKITV